MTTATDTEVADFAEMLAARADLVGINSLSSSEQIIVRAWSAFGIICNGGFQYFYEGSTDILAVADAFNALGLPDAAQACRKSEAQSDAADFDAHFDLLNRMIRELADNDRLVHALAAYIRQTEQQKGTVTVS